MKINHSNSNSNSKPANDEQSTCLLIKLQDMVVLKLGLEMKGNFFHISC